MKKTTSQIHAAQRAHRAGNLPVAAALCQKVLRREPENPDALHLLGVALAEAGRVDEAIVCIAAAIRLAGPHPLYCANLGRIFLSHEHYREAAACFRQALAAAPLDWPLTFQLGRALIGLGDRSHARLAFEQVTALQPRFAESWYNLGVLATMDQQLDRAAACYRQAIAANPGCADAYNNLAILLHGERRYEEAAACYRSAIELDSSKLDTRYNWGRLYEDSGRFEEALKIYRAILSQDPNHTPALGNASNCLLNLGHPREAIDGYRQAIADQPEYVEAHWNLSLALLQTGELAEGWKEYEWRLRQWPALNRGFSQPLWDGSPLDGRRVLLHSEQGLGDTIQFVRYASFVKQLGGHVIVECQPTLARLLARASGVDEIVSRGSDLPHFDLHAPLLSLPRLARTELQSIPAPIPYLTADEELAAWWRDRIPDDGALRVGFAWAGNPQHQNDRRRSLEPRQLEILEQLTGVRFYSLQAGVAGTEALRPSMVALGSGVSDFADTAAAMQHLDLVISVDTSVAHLAGALGRPVWTLLPHPADWRWMEGRTDSPWYSTMRLFRQDQRCCWEPVLEDVRNELGLVLDQIR